MATAALHSVLQPTLPSAWQSKKLSSAPSESTHAVHFFLTLLYTHFLAACCNTGAPRHRGQSGLGASRTPTKVGRGPSHPSVRCAAGRRAFGLSPISLASRAHPLCIPPLSQSIAT